MAASDGSGWSIQDIEHCRRWNRVPECVVGEGWKGGDMAGILSQGLIYAPSQPDTHTRTHTHTKRMQCIKPSQHGLPWRKIEFAE